jgi:hypothetical protein
MNDGIRAQPNALVQLQSQYNLAAKLDPKSACQLQRSEAKRLRWNAACIRRHAVITLESNAWLEREAAEINAVRGAMDPVAHQWDQKCEPDPAKNGAVVSSLGRNAPRSAPAQPSARRRKATSRQKGPHGKAPRQRCARQRAEV